MILSGLEIEKRAKEGKDIIITPFNENQVGPNSYDLRLNNKLRTYALGYKGNPQVNKNYLDMREEPELGDEIEIPESGLILTPGILYLGSTVEYTETHNLVPMLEGRSSIGRLGLAIHVTAGFGDVGFGGHWTLEIFCIHPVKIYPFERVCQIYYHALKGEHKEYQGKYQGAKEIQASRKWLDSSQKGEIACYK